MSTGPGALGQEHRLQRIEPCSGRAFELEAGDELVVIDPLGQQVSDLVAFSRDDHAEYLS